MIRFEGATKTYGARRAVDAVSLEIRDGRFCVLLGESGSGKSTLMRMVNRLVRPTSTPSRAGCCCCAQAGVSALTPVAASSPVNRRRAGRRGRGACSSLPASRAIARSPATRGR